MFYGREMMKSMTLRTLLILSLAAPAFAAAPSQDEGQLNQGQGAAVIAPCDDKEKGTLEDLADRLQALTEPMEQKVEDCDGEVAKAKEVLVGLETSLGKEIQAIGKTHQEILLLKEALGSRGCEITLGGCKFRREVVADGLEKRIQQYQQSAVVVKDLRTTVALQKQAVQAAIAKLERWQAKEKELLQSVELLQKSHEELISVEAPVADGDTLTQAARLGDEVETMLGLKEVQDKSNVSKGNAASKEVVGQDPAETVVADQEDKLQAVSGKEGDSTKQDVTQEETSTLALPVKAVSNAKVIATEVDAEIEVDVEVETEVEVDAEFNLGILDEIFEKP
jgi:hypothetical protein